MSLKINNIDKLMQKLKELNGNITDALKKGIDAGCLIVEADAKRNVKSNTGALRASITHEVIQDKNSVKGVIGTNMKYAPYIELGTGPVGEANMPEIAKQLGITYRKDPWVYYSEAKDSFFTTSGQAGMPYLYPALINNKAEINKIVVTAIQKEIDKLEKK